MPRSLALTQWHAERRRKDEKGKYLHVTLRDVQRCETGVGETARKSTTEHALGVVARIVGDRSKISERVLVSELQERTVGILLEQD